MEDLVLKRIEEVYMASTQLYNPGMQQKDEAAGLKAITRLLQKHGSKPVMQQARRGRVYELSVVLPCMRLYSDKQHLEVDAKVEPHSGDARCAALREVELWRDAEALVTRPHTFEALKQLPELRQIIAHTAVSAVSAADGATHQASVTLAAARANKRQHAEYSSSTLDSDYRDEHLDCYGVRQPELLQLLTPHLRLQLAAEVAAGMLCPGQPPPTNTPEHAAALHLFVNEAFKQVEASLQPGASPVGQVLQAVQEPGVPAPPPGRAGSWALAPHLDLHMQLPPHQLLQMVCESWQLQQEQEQQSKQQPAGSSTIAHGAGSVDTAVTGIGLLHPKQQQGLKLLLQGLKPTVKLLSGVQDFGSKSSSSNVSNQATGWAPYIVQSIRLGSGRSSNSASDQDDHQSRWLGMPLALVISFLQQQWSSSSAGTAASWQQAVPLQMTLLLLLAQQLRAAINAVEQDSDAAGCSTPQGSHSSHAEGTSSTVLHKVVELLQLVRNFREWNAQYDAACPAASSSCSSSCTGVSPGPSQPSSCIAASLDPSQFFSSSGPLARGLWGFSEPPGFGLWASTLPAAAAAARAAGGPGPGSSSSSSSSSSRHLMREASIGCTVWRQQLLMRLAAEAVLASGCLSDQIQAVDMGLCCSLFHDNSAASLIMPFLNSQQHDILADVPDDASAAVWSYQALLLSAGVDVDRRTAVAAFKLQDRLAERLRFRRLQLLDRLGLTQQARDVSSGASAGWCSPDMLPAEPPGATTAVQPARRSSSGSCCSSSTPSSSFSCCSGSVARSHQGAQCLRFQPRPSDGDSNISAVCMDEFGGTASDGDISDDGGDQQQQQLGKADSAACVSAAGVGGVAAAETDACHSGVQGGSVWSGIGGSSCGPGVVIQTLDSGRQASRQLGGAAAAQLVPLHTWLDRWYCRHRFDNASAGRWWSSEQRLQAAGGVKAWSNQQAEARRSRVSGSGGSSRAGHGMHSDQQQQQAFGGHAHNSSSSSSSFWCSGEHDRHPDCPLCQQEQQQQRAGRSSQHSSVFSSPAVPWSDPFMWRRLLWQLLGKLSPAAHAFYACCLAVCPHSSSLGVWSHISSSVKLCLWSGPDADLIDVSLAGSAGLACSLSASEARLSRLKQYARAKNSAFIQSYQPSLTVLSRQVLLALSPLHHNLLPAPETAGLCPSSFPALVGKLLQQQLLDKPVLDVFQHDSSRLSSSDLWWHIGLRRWAALQQLQHNGQQQEGLAAAAVPTLSEQQLEQLYVNPDARLYAAGFAARQLHGSLAHHVTDDSTTFLHDAVVDVTLRQQRLLIARSSDSMWSCAGRTEDDEQLQGVVDEAAAGSLHQQHWQSLLQLLLQSADAHLAPEHSATEDTYRLLRDAELLHLEYQAPGQGSAAGSAKHARELSAALRRQLGRLHGGSEQYTDMQQLLLSGPAMVESLMPPGLWWQRQQELLQLSSTCDACGKIGQDVVMCRACGLALYCCCRCRQKDAEAHSLICCKLQAASKSAASGLLQQLLEPHPQEPSCLRTGGGGLLRLARCCWRGPEDCLLPSADFALHAVKVLQGVDPFDHVQQRLQAMLDRTQLWGCWK